MGFPVGGYTELLLPRSLLRLGLLLGYLRRLVSNAFDAAGLGDLLLDDGLRVSQLCQSAALAVDRALPATRYDGDGSGGSRCAICLCEFERGEAVRKPSDCRHVFHRGCLDRWAEHGRGTCPLCRAPLVSDLAWPATASVAPDAYHDDDCYHFAPTTLAMLLLDHLFSSSAWFDSAADRLIFGQSYRH